MAATASFLHWNPLQWKHLPPRTSPIPSSFPLRIFTTTKPSSSRFTLRCFFDAKHHLNADTKDKTAFERACDAAVKALQVLKKPAITAVLIAALLMYDSASALAASGGRMGGRSFSRSSSSSSSASRSYSVPPDSRSSSSSAESRSYSMPRGSRSSSSSSRSYSVPPDSLSSSSSRSYSVPPDSGPSFSYSAPSYSPSPIDDGELSVGAGVLVKTGLGFLIAAGIAAFAPDPESRSDRDEGGILAATEKTTVLKLQVGLLGTARSLQKDLNRIAEVADTSSSQGLSCVLTETSLAVLRHPDYCISAYSSVDVKPSMEDCEKRFNQLSIEERGKFDEETLVNVNSIKRQSSKSQRAASGFSNDYIVITILVAAQGLHKLPTINSAADLKEALQKLGSIPSGSTLAVEVLWTPQNEDDTLSEHEFHEDYSLLKPL
ncbi:hypothetical protein LINPERHAP2_LOCUS27232 [Linum perenne]